MDRAGAHYNSSLGSRDFSGIIESGMHNSLEYEAPIVFCVGKQKSKTIANSCVNLAELKPLTNKNECSSMNHSSPFK